MEPAVFLDRDNTLIAGTQWNWSIAMHARTICTFLGILIARVALADLVSYQFIGTVDLILGIPDGEFASVRIGDPIIATYTFDTAAPDSNADDQNGAYFQSFGLHIAVGDSEIAMQGYWIDVQNDAPNGYDHYFVHGSDVDTSTVSGVDLKDWTQLVFDSDELPLLTGLDGFDTQEIFIAGGPFHINGTIGELVPACMADLSADGVVGPADLAALLAAWGPNPGDPADLDGDDSVGPADLAALLASWGQCPLRHP